MIFKKEFCPVVGTGSRLCLAKEPVSNEEVRLEAVGTVLALRRRVLGGKEKGAEGRGESTGKQQDLKQHRVLLDRKDVKRVVDQC